MYYSRCYDYDANLFRIMTKLLRQINTNIEETTPAKHRDLCVMPMGYDDGIHKCEEHSKIK